MRYAIYHATGLDEGFEKEQLMQHLNELIKKQVNIICKIKKF